MAAISAEIALGIGPIEEALCLADRAIDIAQEMGGIFAEGMARRTKGQALAALTPPRWDEAEADLTQSLRLLESGQNRIEAAYTHVAWGKVCRDRGDPRVAREHWELAATQWETSGLTHELERTRSLIKDLPSYKQAGLNPFIVEDTVLPADQGEWVISEKGGGNHVDTTHRGQD